MREEPYASESSLECHAYLKGAGYKYSALSGWFRHRGEFAAIFQQDGGYRVVTWSA